MSYIGRGTESISNVEVLDNLTFDGSASYTLQKSSVNFVPSSANNLLISISGVVQQGNFSVSGSTITFDTTVSGSDTCDWILHYGTGLITTVADGAITEAKLGSNAVTTAKINNGAITSAKLDSGLALGKIGQVVSVTHTSDQTTTSTSWSDITGFNVSITPSATTSKILILTDIEFYIAGSGQGLNGLVKVLRDKPSANTDIVQRRSQSYSQDGTGVEYENQVSFIYLDSPSTTSAIDYKIQFRLGSGSSVSVNHSNNKTGSLTLMEVLA